MIGKVQWTRLRNGERSLVHVADSAFPARTLCGLRRPPGFAVTPQGKPCERCRRAVQ